MFNFITIIKPTIIPSIRMVRDGPLFCEPKPIRLIWVGYKCNFMFEKRNITGNAMCIYVRERPNVVSVCMNNSSNSMSFLDIKYPAKRMALVGEYVKAMKTVRRRTMVNREMKLAIGEELQTLFHPIASATKQAAEKTAEELVPVKKALEYIDGALKAQQQHTIPPPLPPQNDLTFGIHATGD